MLAYTSKSFQRCLQMHSCCTGMLQALHTAASGEVALTPGAPSLSTLLQHHPHRLLCRCQRHQHRSWMIAILENARSHSATVSVHILKATQTSLHHLIVKTSPVHTISLIPTPPKSCQTTSYSNISTYTTYQKEALCFPFPISRL